MMTSAYESFKKIFKTGLNRAGFDLVRQKNSPRMTLLGLQARPIRTVIDVGANTGQFAKKISVFFPNAKIYCFEPLPVPFYALDVWAKTQGGRVEPFNLAVGNKEGEIDMFLHEDHTPSSSLLMATTLTGEYYPFTRNQKLIQVKQTTLDGIFTKSDIELFPETLIKLDVQGYENRVIAGGNKIITQAKICVLEVCLDSLYESQADFTELVTMLHDLGYRYSGNLDQEYAQDGHCIFVDSVFINNNL